MSRPVLFYSPNCKYSIELWNKLKQSKKLNMIIKINVNKTKNIPKNIRIKSDIEQIKQTKNTCCFFKPCSMTKIF